jgi:hypothetical protein
MVKFAKKKGWYSEVLSYIPKKDKRASSAKPYTLEQCKKSAAKYSRRVDWAAFENRAYSTAVRNGWLNLCCEHMQEKASSPSKRSGKKLTNLQKKLKRGPLKRGRVRIYTKDLCRTSALQYKTMESWRNTDPKHYKAALREKWMEYCTSHMKKPFVSNKKITEAMCVEAVKDFTTTSEWREKSPSTYNYAKRKGLIDKVGGHLLKSKVGRPSKWTKEACIEAAKSYQNRSEWKKGDGASYQAALKNDWFKEATSHMDKNYRMRSPFPIRPEGMPLNTFWTIDLCKECSKRFKTADDWRERHPESYAVAVKKGWREKCTKHMLPKYRKATRSNRELTSNAIIRGIIHGSSNPVKQTVETKKAIEEEGVDQLIKKVFSEIEGKSGLAKRALLKKIGALLKEG